MPQKLTSTGRHQRPTLRSRPSLLAVALLGIAAASSGLGAGGCGSSTSGDTGSGNGGSNSGGSSSGGGSSGSGSGSGSTSSGSGGGSSSGSGSGSGSGSSSGGSGAPDASTADGGPTGPFVHPGILITKSQLDYVKSQIAAMAEPQKTAFAAAQAAGQQLLSYTAQPVAMLACSSNSTDPATGLTNPACKAEQADSDAAYQTALLWYLTGNDAYAKKSIEIMNAWSAVLKTHSASNAPVQSGWTASVWPRAAEIIRYTYSGWPQAQVDQFANMLTTAYLPLTIKGTPNAFQNDNSTTPGKFEPNGNWELVMIEASVAIAVFTDDKATFNKALDQWRARVPAYIYLEKDGPLPAGPPTGSNPPYTPTQIQGYWDQGKTLTFQTDGSSNGVAQESCRDFHHTEYGFDGIVHVAETAHIQGVDLYGEQKDRIVAGFEFLTKYSPPTSAAAPAWLCGGAVLADADYGLEVGYNHYAKRLNVAMPNTQAFLQAKRPMGADHHRVWETLTHGDVGDH